MPSQAHKSAASTAPNWLTPTEALARDFDLPDDEQLQRPTISEQKQLTFVQRRGFHVGTLALLIPTDLVGELVRGPHLCPVPNTAEWLLGLANVRGHLVPVLDSHALFGAQRPHRAKPWVLVLGQDDTMAGLVIDDVPVIKRFSPEHRLTHKPPLPDTIETHKRDVYKDESGLWVELEPHALFETLSNSVAV